MNQNRQNIYIYIYIYREREREGGGGEERSEEINRGNKMCVFQSTSLIVHLSGTFLCFLSPVNNNNL